MNIGKISVKNIKIKPTNKKIEKTKKTLDKVGVLPKEAPIEKKIYLEPIADTFERIKDEIQIRIDRIKK